MDTNCCSDEDMHNYEALLFELSPMVQRTLKDLSAASKLCPLENMQLARLQVELNQLKERVRLLEEETINTKRKRWCSWCLQEAIFYSKSNRFYCCSQCEQLDILLSEDY